MQEESRIPKKADLSAIRENKEEVGAMEVKTVIEGLAEEYLALKEKEEQLKNRIGTIRSILVKHATEVGPFPVADKVFTLEKRESFEYNPELMRKIVGEDQYHMIKEVIISKKKVKGLLKGGFITQEQIEPAKAITRSAMALVIK